MQLDIHAHGLALSPSLHGRITRRIQSALGRLAPGIRRAIVRLEDINGPRGGHDIRALVQLLPVRSARVPMVAEDVSGDAVGAVGRAVERAAGQLRRVRSMARSKRRAR